MHKLRAVRRRLMERLGIAPANLLTWAEDGTVISHRAPSDGPGDARARPARFELRYRANIVVTDYTRPSAELFFAMLGWLHADNPGVKPDALSFHVYVLDRRRSDVHLHVDLSETIQAEAVAGGLSLRPAAEADALAFTLGDFHDWPDSAPATADSTEATP